MLDRFAGAYSIHSYTSLMWQSEKITNKNTSFLCDRANLMDPRQFFKLRSYANFYIFFYSGILSLIKRMLKLNMRYNFYNIAKFESQQKPFLVYFTVIACHFDGFCMFRYI